MEKTNMTVELVSIEKIIPEARLFCVNCVNGFDSYTEKTYPFYVNTAKNLASVMRMSAQLGDSPAKQKALLSEYHQNIPAKRRDSAIFFFRVNFGLQVPERLQGE